MLPPVWPAGPGAAPLREQAGSGSGRCRDVLIQQSAIYLLARLLVGLIAMATTALLTRLLTPVTYGQYGLALVVMTFGAQTLFNWIVVSTARLYQARRGDPSTPSTFAQICVLTAAGSGMAFLLAWAGGVVSGDTARIYGVGFVLMVAYAWFELLSSFEVVNFRPGTYLSMSLGRAVLIMAGAGGAAWLTGDPVWTALGYGAGMFGASALGRTRDWSLRPSRFDPALARQICRFGLPLAGCMALSALSTSGTRLLINHLDSAEALGLFTAAYVVVQSTLGVLAFGVVAAGYQLAVQAVESGDPAAARQQLVANLSLLFAVIAPAALGMALTADGLAQTLVGAQVFRRDGAVGAVAGGRAVLRKPAVLLFRPCLPTRTQAGLPGLDHGDHGDGLDRARRVADPALRSDGGGDGDGRGGGGVLRARRGARPLLVSHADPVRSAGAAAGSLRRDGGRGAVLAG